MKRLLLSLVVAFAFVPLCSAGTRDLRQSTPVTIVVGPFVDSAGASTSPTVTGVDVTGYKNNGTIDSSISPTASGGDNDMVATDDGYYSLELTSSNTDSAGYYRLTFQVSSSLIFHEDFNILPANIYDSKYGSDKLEVDAVQFGGANGTFAAGIPAVNSTQLSGSTQAADHAELVYDSDFAVNYDQVNGNWLVDTVRLGGGTTPVANLTTVFSTDFANNYDATNDLWKTNVMRLNGISQTAGDIIGDTNDIQSRLPAALGANGNIKADVRDLLGTAWLTPGTAGTPDVNVKQVGGTTQTARDLGASVLVGDKTGFSLTQSFPENFSSLSIDSNGRIDVGKWDGTTIPGVDMAGYPKVTIKDGTGTGEIDTNGGAVVRVLEKGFCPIVSEVSVLNNQTNFEVEATNDGIHGANGEFDDWIVIARDVSDTHVPKLASARRVTSSLVAQSQSGHEISISSAFGFTLSAGDTIELYPPDFETLTRLPNAGPGTNGGVPTVNASNYVAGIQGTINTFDALDTAQDTQHANTLTAVAGVQSDTDNIQTRLPTALVGGRMDSSTGSMANNVLTDAAINANAFTAAKFHPDVTTEFQTGLPPQSYFEALFDNAPTFADAMDDHGYTTPRAMKLENLDNLDMPVSEVRAQTPSLLVSTTIDGAPSSQTTLVLADGPPNNDALNGALIIVTNNDPMSEDKAVGLVKDYDGTTHTVTLVSDPGVFTMGDGDKVDVIAGATAVPLWLSGP